MTEDFYTDDRESVADRMVVQSPSGRSRLLLRYHATKPGCWSYSRGTLYRCSDGAEMIDIKRNYDTFHHSWVTKDGTEYLITGRHYMRPLVVNADAGTSVEGSGAFCWRRVLVNGDASMLLVSGCFWGGPDEYKFFDFGDPSRELPELPILAAVDAERPTYIDFDEHPPSFGADGSVTLYRASEVFKPTGQRDDDITIEDLKAIDDDAYDNEANWTREVDARYTLRRHGQAMVIEDTWRSPWLIERERRQAEWQAKVTAQHKEWLDTSAILASLKAELHEDETVRLCGVGWIGSSQRDRENGDPNEWYFWPRLVSVHENPNTTARLKWGTISGPIVAELWTRGTGNRYEEFERDDDGLRAAIAAVRLHLNPQGEAE